MLPALRAQQEGTPGRFLEVGTQVVTMRVVQRFRTTKLAMVAVVLVALALSSCRATPVHTLQPASHERSCIVPTHDEEVLIGLAVSGGGSRAALFAVGAFQALAHLRVGADNRSLLEQVSHISSVSGGSLASAYFALRKPPREIPMLASDDAMTEEYRQFFTNFADAMAHDYEGPLFWRQLSHFRWFNPAWTAKSLAEVLAEEYLGTATFAELAQREARGDSPRLLINTTLYNDGRRFLLSSLPRQASRFDLIQNVFELSSGNGLLKEHETLLRARWESLLSVTPQDLNLDLCSLRVAAGVAGSMSFPPIIGPISLQVSDEERFWHVGDGGLSDNTGAESLLMVFSKLLKEQRARKALILMLDSSFPFEVGGEALDRRHEGFTLFSYDFSRIPSIMEERSIAYRSLFFTLGQVQGLVPGARSLEILRLRHTDAEWAEDLSDLPESCREEKVDWKSPRDVSRRLAGIVTRLWLKSTCDRDLVLTAAAKVVAQNEAKIRTFLEH